MKKKIKTIVFSMIAGGFLLVGFYPRTYYYHASIYKDIVQRFDGKCVSKCHLPRTAAYVKPVYRFNINYVQHTYITTAGAYFPEGTLEYQSCLRMITCEKLNEKYKKWIKI